jgi:CheY-like chemotaxis protein
MGGTRRITTTLTHSPVDSPQLPGQLTPGGSICQAGVRQPTARVLMVDHDKTHAAELRLALERHHFQVTQYADKEAVLRELRRNVAEFDVVMLDLSLHRAEDFELFDRVRQLLWAADHLALILCFSRVNLGPRMRLQIERRGGRLVYER